MTLQHHRPDGRGGLVPRPPTERDWRRGLQSPRWGASLPGSRLPEITNPEMDPTPTGLAVVFWAGLAILTFVVLVLGYGTGFWH
ncbi:MAG TPA: hypothetical protein VH723_06125 [Candidatus Limnocylindrales bacterium]|jgi:hypothetical protein